MSKEDGFGNHRSPEAQRYDAFCDQAFRIEEAAKRMVEGGQHQTVVHKQTGMGALGVICAVVCVVTALFVVIEIIRLETRFDGRFRDLEAWNGVNSAKIAKLEAQQQPQSK